MLHKIHPPTPKSLLTKKNKKKHTKKNVTPHLSIVFFFLSVRLGLAMFLLQHQPLGNANHGMGPRTFPIKNMDMAVIVQHSEVQIGQQSMEIVSEDISFSTMTKSLP